MFDKLVHKWLRVPYTLHVGSDIGPQQPKLTIVFVHGLANSHTVWDEVMKTIDKNTTRVISIDLLGFGNSPKPNWMIYSTITHARALYFTLRSKQVRGPVLVVGHSLGSLIAIQYAAKYPGQVQSLLLCSPPFYKPSQLPKEARIGVIKQADDAYHALYRSSRSRHELAVRLAMFLKSAKLLSKHFVINEATLPAIISSLEMSIENQTSLDDAKNIHVPTRIIHAQFDPFVIKRHLKELASANHNIHIHTIPTGHDISSLIYRKAVSKHIEKFTKELTQKA